MANYKSPPGSLLIDGDIYLYRAASAAEKEIRWDEENHVLFSNAEDAWGTLMGSIDALMERFETDKHAVCLSEGRCFRYEIDPNYKSNRIEVRKPLCFAELKKRLTDNYKCVGIDGLEADDVIGLLSKQYASPIVCSADKDMKTIPGVRIWDGKELSGIITQEEADYWLCYQTLVGDTADGYKGCPGIGDVKAKKLLIKTDTMGNNWARVVNAYNAAGLSTTDAITTARLARILRPKEWTQINGPKLWSP